MLEFRVGQSYSKPEQERKDHISPLKKEGTTIEGIVTGKQIAGNTTDIGFKGNDTKGKNGDIEPTAVRPVVYVPRVNEMDTSILELLDDLKSKNDISPIKVELVKEISENDPGILKAKENVADRLHVPLSEVKQEYAELKSYLTLMYYHK